MTGTHDPKPSLPPVLHAAIEKFDQWTKQHMESEEIKNTIETTLYQHRRGRP